MKVKLNEVAKTKKKLTTLHPCSSDLHNLIDWTVLNNIQGRNKPL